MGLMTLGAVLVLGNRLTAPATAKVGSDPVALVEDLHTPSNGWLGKFSPKAQIRESGLWQIHYLRAAPLSSAQMDLVTAAIERSIQPCMRRCEAPRHQPTL
jgi:hypothetical protein